MAKLLVLYYSSYGHIETMAEHFAQGAREVSGVEVDVRRAPETAPSTARWARPSPPRPASTGGRRRR